MFCNAKLNASQGGKAIFLTAAGVLLTASQRLRSYP